MSVSDAPQCTYCNRFGHHAEECAAARGDRRTDHALGWAAVAFMAPFALAGFLAGFAFSGFMAGLRFSISMWSKAWKLLAQGEK